MNIDHRLVIWEELGGSHRLRGPGYLPRVANEWPRSVLTLGVTDICVFWNNNDSSATNACISSKNILVYTLSCSSLLRTS